MATAKEFLEKEKVKEAIDKHITQLKDEFKQQEQDKRDKLAKEQADAKLAEERKEKEQAQFYKKLIAVSVAAVAVLGFYVYQSYNQTTNQ